MACKAADDLPDNVFRVALVPNKVAQTELLALVKKLAPRMSAKDITHQMATEGGIDGRAADGVNAAIVSTAAFESALLLGTNTSKMYAEAGRQLGGVVAHELGHAMGIPKNQGKGLMFGTYEVDLDDPTPISNSHFEAADTKIILATLDGLV